MEIVTRDAARQLAVSQRQVQRMARGGRVITRTVAGRTVISGRSLLAASRSAARGRYWDDTTVRAACELLDGGSTTLLAGSQRSRLRARLRTMSVAELAHQALGRRVTIWRSTRREATSIGEVDDGLSSTGSRLNIKVTANARSLAKSTRMLEDADGETIVVEIDTEASDVVEDIALYAYGDARTSDAARRRVEARQERLL